MIIIVAVVVGAVAFFVGTKFQSSQSGTASQYGQNGSQRSGRFGQNGRATVGEVVGQDQGSITVKLQDGSSKIINVTGQTTYSKTDKAAKADIAVGQRIAAFGTVNSDGSIDAQSVQLNPQIRQGAGQGGNTMPPQNSGQ